MAPDSDADKLVPWAELMSMLLVFISRFNKQKKKKNDLYWFLFKKIVFLTVTDMIMFFVCIF